MSGRDLVWYVLAGFLLWRGFWVGVAIIYFIWLAKFLSLLHVEIDG
jgi:hypothetical protein